MYIIICTNINGNSRGGQMRRKLRPWRTIKLAARSRRLKSLTFWNNGARRKSKVCAADQLYDIFSVFYRSKYSSDKCRGRQVRCCAGGASQKPVTQWRRRQFLANRRNGERRKWASPPKRSPLSNIIIYCKYIVTPGKKLVYGNYSQYLTTKSCKYFC